ncbi:hypothetical protein MNBD_NITROSPINAE01-854 [hydrothermal vent metagenome]|uniref:AsmA-like C-terminal domain-containing protein n=1 Tax=hydrothermal vent metagenome TaxID=652676 RepID=A0A3B1C295_9ZZZZ
MSSKPGEPEPTKKKEKHKACSRKTPITVCFLYLTAWVIAFLVALPLLLEKVQLEPLLERVVSKKLGLNFSVDDIDIRIFDGPGVTFSNIIVSKAGKPLASVKQAVVDISLNDALKGTFSFSQILLKKPTIHLVRQKDGTFNVPLLNKKVTKTKGATAGKKITAISALAFFGQVKLEDGVFYWEDNAVGTAPFRTMFTNAQISIARRGLVKSLALKVTGELKTGGVPPALLDIDIKANPVLNKEWKLLDVALSGSASIDQLDIKNVWPYIAPHLPLNRKLKGIASWNGNISGSKTSGFLSSGNFVFKDVRLGDGEVFADKVPPQTITINYDTGLDDNTVTINSAKATMGVIELTASGTAKEINTPNPKILVTLGMNEVDLDDIKCYLPEKALTAQQATFLNKNLVAGKIALKNFTFDGDLEKLRKIGTPESLRAFSGKLSLNEMKISLPTLTYPFLDIAGSITLSQNELYLDSLTGRYGASRLADVSGYLTDIHGWPSFGVYIKADVNLDEAKRILSAKVTSPELKNQIEKIEEVKGNIKVDLTIAGDTADITSTLSMDGEIMFDNVAMRHKSFELPLLNLNGKMEMSQDDFYIENLSWKMGSSPCSVYGTLLNAFQKDPKLDITIKSTMSLDKISDIWLMKFSDIYTQTGTAKMEMSVRGNVSHFKVSQKLDMTEAEYRLANVIQKQNGLKNIYALELSVTNLNKLKTDRLLVDIGESRFEVNGDLGAFANGKGIDLTFSSDGMLFDDMDRFFKVLDDIDGGGYISGAFSLKKESPKKEVKLLGTLRLENANFKLSIFSGIFREANGIFELVNNKLFLRDANGRFGNGKFTLSANAVFKAKPIFNINMEAESLDLKDFLRTHKLEETREKVEKKKPGYLARGEWNIKGTSQKGKIGIISYDNLNLTMRFANDTFNMAPINLSAYGGSITIDGELRILGNGMIGFGYNFKAQDIEMNDYMEDALKTKEVISGKLNLTGHVKGKGATIDLMKRSLAGSLSISSDEGVIHKFTVFSKIFSLLNVSQYFKLKFPDLAVHGMPFNNIKADFKLSSGIARTENLMIDSEAMRISAVGDYNVADAAIDMKIGVMPFRTIDRLATSIPMFGEVLTGENKALLGLYFTAEGPVGGPNVKAIPLQSIAGGIGGLLKRIMELPVNAAKAMGEVLQKDEKAGSNNAGTQQKEILEGQVD